MPVPVLLGRIGKKPFAGCSSDISQFRLLSPASWPLNAAGGDRRGMAGARDRHRTRPVDTDDADHGQDWVSGRPLILFSHSPAASRVAGAVPGGRGLDDLLARVP